MQTALEVYSLFMHCACGWTTNHLWLQMSQVVFSRNFYDHCHFKYIFNCNAVLMEVGGIGDAIAAGRRDDEDDGWSLITDHWCIVWSVYGTIVRSTLWAASLDLDILLQILIIYCWSRQRRNHGVESPLPRQIPMTNNNNPLSAWYANKHQLSTARKSARHVVCIRLFWVSNESGILFTLPLPTTNQK